MFLKIKTKVMPEKKPKGRDFPLAPTSMPQAIDNTSVQKPAIVNKEYPKFTYKEGKFNNQDSSTYKKGFEKGLKEKGGDPTNLGGKFVVGLSDKYNQGYSEGKDVAITKRGSKGLDPYKKSVLEDFKKKNKN